MKDKLNNIKKIIRDNSKVVVPLIVALAILIILFVTLYFYKYNSYHKDEKLNFYNYTTSAKNEFEGLLSRNRKNEIISFDVGKDIYLGNYPVYNRKEKIVIFPSEMNVVYATNEFVQYGINSYSYLYYDINDYKLIDKGYNDYIKHTFLYDGKDLYFFLDKVKLSIGDKNIELSPLSMVVGNIGNNIVYYDYESDKAEFIEYTKQDVVISNKYYSVNIMQDNIDYYGDVRLLVTNMDSLEKISSKK